MKKDTLTSFSHPKFKDSSERCSVPLTDDPKTNEKLINEETSSKKSIRIAAWVVLIFAIIMLGLSFFFPIMFTEKSVSHPEISSNIISVKAATLPISIVLLVLSVILFVCSRLDIKK